MKAVNHNHSWVRLTKECKYCLQCYQLVNKMLAKEESVVDISEFFETKLYKNSAQNLTERITFINRIYEFLKRKNPDSSEEDLLITLKKHLEQQKNENDLSELVLQRHF